jgi:transcriptional regulator with XRE-family HTH domain
MGENVDNKGPEEPFANQLRRYRRRSSLTQERLAELAQVSAAGIAALEAGRRKTPRASTVLLLIGALGLSGEEHMEMISAASANRLSGDPRSCLSVMAGLSDRFAFVGRERELDRLHNAWQRACRVIVVEGEAGAGKTRLVCQFAGSLAPSVTVLWGHCTPDRNGMYEPFVKPIRWLVGRHGGSMGNTELTRFLATGAMTADCEQPFHADPMVERRLLFEAVIGVLAPVRPLLLVLDDMQWADAASIALLTYMVSSPELHGQVSICVVRSTDQDPVNAGSLAELNRIATIERVIVDGLEDDAVAELVAHVVGEAPNASLVATIRDATDGNALFVEELTEHLLACEGNTGAAGFVPVNVRATLNRRISMLSKDAQALLRAGAVLGRSFEIELAGSLVGLESDCLLAAEEGALLSGLVNEKSATVLSFRHTLVQSAVYETTFALRRHTLHRRAAETLEGRLSMAMATSRDPSVFEIARHWLIVASADAAAAPVAARWAMRAGNVTFGGAGVQQRELVT